MHMSRKHNNKIKVISYFNGFHCLILLFMAIRYEKENKV